MREHGKVARASSIRAAAVATAMSRWRQVGASPAWAAWWVALAALVINDHLLKRAGWLPGWLTGKLSDFAGLIVAPVLLAAIARARAPRGRALCFALVAAVFAAVKLSPGAARALEAAAAFAAVPSRIWCDETDLLALAVLPLAWRISLTGDGGTGSTADTNRRAVHPAAVILGGLACVATSAAYTNFRASTFLMNRSTGAVDVQIYRVRASIDCASVAADGPEQTLAATDFAPESCQHLASGDLIPLSRNWQDGDFPDAAGPGGPTPACDAVVLRARGLPDTLLFWHGLADIIIPTDLPDAGSLDDRGIYLERAGDRLFAAGSKLITSRTAPFALAAIDCAAVSPDAGAQGDHP